MNNDVVFTCPKCRSNNHYYGNFDKKQLQLKYDKFKCKFCDEYFELNKTNFNYETCKIPYRNFDVSKFPIHQKDEILNIIHDSEVIKNKMPIGTKKSDKSKTDYDPCIFLRLSKDGEYLLGHFANPNGKSIIATIEAISRLVDGKDEFIRCKINKSQRE